MQSCVSDTGQATSVVTARGRAGSGKLWVHNAKKGRLGCTSNPQTPLLNTPMNYGRLCVCGLLCDVCCRAQPPLIDSSLRFLNGQNQLFQRELRLSGVHHNNNGRLYVRSDAEQVAAYVTTPSSPAMEDNHEAPRLSVKCASGPAPEVKRVCLFLYDSVFCARPVQSWQLVIHAVEQVNLRTTLGQRLASSLVLRVDKSRNVQCFSSHLPQLSVSPKAPFRAAQGVANEVGVTFQPSFVGNEWVTVNAVDVDRRELVRTWLVHAQANTPVVSKAFEISVAVGKPSNKRVSYTNDYPVTKVFYLETDRPDLIHFKDKVMELSPGEKQHIGLKFFAVAQPGMTEMLVFINDADGSNEATFVIKAVYEKLESEA
eukprot:m.325945 g.325945  ORF g.325945 m.325945 type:complete len:371 (+) comp19739_c0_seq11:3368-4480(+)